MILLLLFANLLNKSSSAQGRVIDPRASVHYLCDDINRCRTLFDIVCGCLTTIFVCTWVSVHPNVPAPNQGRIMTLGRRLRLMLLTVIAPELMVGFAARQFLSARRFSKGRDTFFSCPKWIQSLTLDVRRIQGLENARILFLYGWFRVAARKSHRNAQTTR